MMSSSTIKIVIKALSVLILVTIAVGKPKPRTIVIGNGEYVDPEEAINHNLTTNLPSDARYSWILPLYQKDSHAGFESLDCAASLISPKFLVTAAHCLCFSSNNDFESNIDVKELLVGKISASTSRKRKEFYKVKSYSCHPDWDTYQRLVPGDIAIIELDNSTKDIEPVKLASETLALNGTERFTALGWGKDENQRVQEYLKKVNLDQAGNSSIDCFSMYSAVKRNEWFVNQSHVICTVAAGGKDACGGDSGGPLVLREGQSNILVGVTSYGDSKYCAGVGSKITPSIFSDVRKYRQWINSYISKNGRL